MSPPSITSTLAAEIVFVIIGSMGLLSFLFILLHCLFNTFSSRRYTSISMLRPSDFIDEDDGSTLETPHSLDPTILNSLPVSIFNSGEYKESMTCSVCLYDMSQSQKIRFLPKCNHGFHLDCIDMWFRFNSTCPICRTPVTFYSPPPQVQPVEENVTDWGHQDEADLEMGFTSTTPSAKIASSSRLLSIEIPKMEVFEVASHHSPVRNVEGINRSPIDHLRNLGRRLAGLPAPSPSTPSIGDIEQGLGS